MKSIGKAKRVSLILFTLWSFAIIFYIHLLAKDSAKLEYEKCVVLSKDSCSIAKDVAYDEFMFQFHGDGWWTIPTLILFPVVTIAFLWTFSYVCILIYRWGINSDKKSDKILVKKQSFILSISLFGALIAFIFCYNIFETLTEFRVRKEIASCELDNLDNPKPLLYPENMVFLKTCMAAKGYDIKFSLWSCRDAISYNNYMCYE